jgi:hypothetical protein
MSLVTHRDRAAWVLKYMTNMTRSWSTVRPGGIVVLASILIRWH